LRRLRVARSAAAGRPEYVVASVPKERTWDWQADQAAEELSRGSEAAGEPLTVVTAAHVVVHRAALLRGQRSDPGRHQRREALAFIAALSHQQVADRVAQRLLGSIDEDRRVAYRSSEDVGDLTSRELSAQAEI